MTHLNNINRNKFLVLSKEELDGFYFDILEAPTSSKIRDTRKIKDFKTVVFSGPLKSHVMSALDKSIAEEKLEASNYWAFQLLLSGHISPLLDRLISIASKQINIANPHLPTFIKKKISEWEGILNHKRYSKESLLDIRNNQEMRHLVIEIVSILCLSRKRKMETIPKLKANDFSVAFFKSKLEAQDTQMIDHILKEEDPSEIRIAANEFLYQLTKKNINKTLYWLSWILEWEKINTKKYKIFKVAPRYNDKIDKKFINNVIWLIWEIIHYVKKSDFDIELDCHTQLDALWNLYCHKFTLGSRTRKLNYILWSIKFLTTPKCDWNVKLIERPHLLFHTLANVNLMVRKIKPKEINKGIYDDKQYKIRVENNYLMTDPNQQLNAQNLKADAKLQKDMEKARQKRIKEAKKKKISLQSMDKINQLREIDKFLNF